MNAAPIITATLTNITNITGPSRYRVTFCTPDGVSRSRTGTLTECTVYAHTKAIEHNVLVRFVD